MSIFDDKACCDGEYPVKACVSLKNITCHGENNGEAAVTVYGGIAPYSFQWSDPNNSVTQTVKGLPAGSYTVRVTDATGMTVTVPFSINEPDDLTVVVDSYVEPTMTQFGILELTIDGGVENYTFDLQINGTDTQVIEWCNEHGTNEDCGCNTHCCTSSVQNIYVAYADDELGTNMNTSRACTTQTTSGYLRILEDYTHSNEFRTSGLRASNGRYIGINYRNGFNYINEGIMVANQNGIIYDNDRTRDPITFTVRVEKSVGWTNQLLGVFSINYIDPNDFTIKSQPVDLVALDANGFVDVTITTVSSNNWSSPNNLTPLNTSGSGNLQPNNVVPRYQYRLVYYNNDGLDLTDTDQFTLTHQAVTSNVCQCYRAVLYTNNCYDTLSPSLFQGQWELMQDSLCSGSSLPDPIDTPNNGIGGIYTYVAYADDDAGANFNLDQGNRCFVAHIVSDIEITTPTLTDFAGAKWTNVCESVASNPPESCDSAAGAYTYVAYADDQIGTNFSWTRKETVIPGEPSTKLYLYQEWGDLKVYRTDGSIENIGIGYPAGVHNSFLCIVSTTYGRSVAARFPIRIGGDAEALQANAEGLTKEVTLRFKNINGSTFTSPEVIKIYDKRPTGDVLINTVDLTTIGTNQGDYIDVTVTVTSTETYTGSGQYEYLVVLENIDNPDINRTKAHSVDVSLPGTQPRTIKQCYKAVTYLDTCLNTSMFDEEDYKALFQGNWNLIQDSQCANVTIENPIPETGNGTSGSFFTYHYFADDELGNGLSETQGDKCFFVSCTTRTDLTSFLGEVTTNPTKFTDRLLYEGGTVVNLCEDVVIPKPFDNEEKIFNHHSNPAQDYRYVDFVQNNLVHQIELNNKQSGNYIAEIVADFTYNDFTTGLPGALATAFTQQTEEIATGYGAFIDLDLKVGSNSIHPGALEYMRPKTGVPRTTPKIFQFSAKLSFYAKRPNEILNFHYDLYQLDFDKTKNAIIDFYGLECVKHTVIIRRLPDSINAIGDTYDGKFLYE